jgi:hypothetical protein
MTQLPLVHQKQFVQATRDTGYRNTAAAVAELVDNAVQAGADRVDIQILEDRVDGEREVTLAVRDNGYGMSRKELQEALRWGGSSRFNDRTGLGRFGMGLPNSSVSQGRRVEVYSWRSSARPTFCYVDLDEIAQGTLGEIPKPSRRKLPSWASGADAASGTLVVWTKCDRLDYKKAGTLVRRLAPELGRIFRRLLWGRLRLTINGHRVPGVDPLYLHRRAPLSGATEPVPPLVYDIRTPSGDTSSVQVRFALLPIAQWRELSTKEKRASGIVGGAGVSVLRARREIAHGWYFMGGKKRQNYDDWWRVEVEFDPELDEMMGVTHSKQGIRPGPEITDILSPEISETARRLSARVRDEFASLDRKRPTAAAARASARDRRLPRVAVQGDGRRERVAHLAYRIVVNDSAEADFFTWELTEGELRLAINRNHPFFRSVYDPVREAGLTALRTDLELLLLAYSRAEAVAATGGALGETRPLRTLWSDVFATFLGD